MSVTPVSELKDYLNIIHNGDDDKIQRILNGAEAESLNYMNRTEFGELCPQDSNYEYIALEMPDDVKTAIFLLSQAVYEAGASDAMQMRKIAEIKLMPYRCQIGV